MITILFIVVACLLLVVVIQMFRGRSLTQLPPGELAMRMRPVDIAAFCNLIDPDEENFLRSSLPPSLFRSVHRERLIAATEYVSAVSYNAAILVRIGEAARHYSDPVMVQAGHELSNNAVRLRLHCSLVLLKMWTTILIPGTSLSPDPLAERYQHLSALARQLSRMRLQASVDASAII
jgi:hypothetical protein